MATGTGRVQFENNIIPAGRINAITQTLLALYPLPNIEGTGAGGFTNNYRTHPQQRHGSPQLRSQSQLEPHAGASALGQVQPHECTRATISSTSRWAAATTTAATRRCISSPAGRPGRSARAAPRQRVRRVDVRSVRAARPISHLGTWVWSWASPAPTIRGAAIRATRACRNSATGFTALGNSPTWTPDLYRDEGTVSFNTNADEGGRASTISGPATAWITSHLDNWQPERANPRGRFDFRRQRNAGRSAPDRRPRTSTTTYAAFLLGLVGTAAQELSVPALHGREWQHAMFFRDRWTVKPQLTLDLGVRWEYYPIMTPRRSPDRIARSKTLDVLIGGVGGNPEEHGARRSEGRLHASGRRHLSAERQDRPAHRLRRDATRRAGCPRRKRSAAISVIRSC